MSPNVDITNGYCGTKLRCSHGKGILKTIIAVAATVWTGLNVQKLTLSPELEVCMEVGALDGIRVLLG